MSQPSPHRPLTIMDIKAALKDDRFRRMLPAVLEDKVKKFLDNPGCSCNAGLYKELLSSCQKQLQEYFPDRSMMAADEQQRASKERYTVIDCHVGELESRLNKLPPGKKLISPARFEDRVVVIITELDAVG